MIRLSGLKLGTDINIIYTGLRPGEKLYEVLVTSEEMVRGQDLGDYFRILADNRDLNYDKYFSKGNKKIETAGEYDSANTKRLNQEEMEQLLKKLDLFGGPISTVI